MDWDEAYRQEQAPAWNLGEPQPELAKLIDREGAVRGEVLDAGCGYAELSLALAARGYRVVGVELTPTAVEIATATAKERGLSNVTFVQADISSLTGFDGRFSTIFDSGLLHALPADARDNYLQSMYRAATAGAKFYILAFGAGAFPGYTEPLPAQFSEDELRDLVSKYFHVDEIRPASLCATNTALPVGSESSTVAAEERGWVPLPGWLVTASKEN
ncbi:SAM-dependent methyltransferase [Mycobacterium sp. 852002-51163_SCH5372311]|nr:SAM-dependent methyltransferase [Mycobacterium sp. 852002-51163_SCH5372311]